MIPMSRPSNERQLLRPLLPAIKSPDLVLPTSPTDLRKRTHVTGACEACRKHKSKCSAERPQCGSCLRFGRECVYTTGSRESTSQALKRKYAELQGQVSPHEELYQLLKSMSEDEGGDAIRRIRSGDDAITVLSDIKTGSLLLQLALVPETRLRYEFPYRAQFPEDLLVGNPYLDSWIYEAGALYSTGPGSHSSGRKKSSMLQVLVASEYQSLYLKPHHAGEVIEPRLATVKPSLWTSVCKDDILMRDLIGVYLRCDYAFPMAFQKDYFLEDMTVEKTEFCSSLLVNAVLAHSCASYSQLQNRAEYWNPHSLSYRFFAEAKRLWELQARRPCITTIQAGVILNTIANFCTLDKLGRAYSVQAVDLANEMCLFEDSTLIESERTRNGRAYTAWMLYNWETLIGFHFLKSPSIKQPPTIPFPEPVKEDQWYNEIWVKYPLNKNLLPTYFGQVVRARLKFRIIMNEFCQVAFGEESSMTLGKANYFHLRLKGWYTDLPDCLKPRSIVLPSHFQLHLEYYYFIICLYKPFVDDRTDQSPPPQQTIRDAHKFLQTLLRLYYLRHGFEAMDLSLAQPLAFVGFTCIAAISEGRSVVELEASRSMLLLIAKGLHDQSRNHYMGQILFRVIQGQMRPEEAALLSGVVKLTEDDSRQIRLQNIQSQWPVGIISRPEDLETQELSKLVEKFVDLELDVSEDESGKE